MKKIPRVCTLYNKTYDNFSHEADYEPIIYDLGCVLLKIDDKNYQGDSYVLYGDENGSGPFGFLNFGWGSCSGCDALQACDSWEEIQELYDNLKSSILWFNNVKQAYDWFMQHDWNGDYSTTEKRIFIKTAREMLKTIIDEMY